MHASLVYTKTVKRGTKTSEKVFIHYFLASETLQRYLVNTMKTEASYHLANHLKHFRIGSHKMSAYKTTKQAPGHWELLPRSSRVTPVSSGDKTYAATPPRTPLRAL